MSLRSTSTRRSWLAVHVGRDALAGVAGGVVMTALQELVELPIVLGPNAARTTVGAGHDGR